MSNYTGSVPDTKRKTDWRAEGACAGQDPERWFPKSGNTPAVQDAKGACFGCPSQLACAQFALTTNQETGVWGGLSEGQRRTIRKKYTLKELENPNTVETAVRHALRSELNPELDLRTMWEEYSHNLPGGHIGWRGPVGSFNFRGIAITPKQLAYLVDRGHKPTGIIRRVPECPVIECVHPRHIADNKERCRRAAAERAAAERAAAEALAGELAS